MTIDPPALYAARDHAAQGEHYLRHIDAMTRERLHAKSDIAAELAHRDMEIIRLSGALELIAAQHSGTVCSTTRSDCMAAIAAAAIRA